MKEFFDRFKVVIFIVYALIAGLLFALLNDVFSLWKLLVYIPMGVFGGLLLWKLFPRSSEEHLTVIRVKGDGSVLITKSALSRSISDACKAIKEIKYLGGQVENSRTGINVVINIKVLQAKLVQTSELVKEFVKNLLEEELNVKTNKIDIIIKKASYTLKVNKIDPTQPEGIEVEEEEEEVVKRSVAYRAIEKVDPANLAPAPEYNSEYTFAVGNEKKRVILKGGDEDKSTPQYKVAPPAQQQQPVQFAQQQQQQQQPVQFTQQQPVQTAHPVTQQPSVQQPVQSSAAPKTAEMATTAEIHKYKTVTGVTTSNFAARPVQPTAATSVQPALVRPAAPAAASVTAAPAPAPKASPAPTPVTPASSPQPAVSANTKVDLAAELARRKAEREAFLNKLNNDSNKLN